MSQKDVKIAQLEQELEHKNIEIKILEARIREITRPLLANR
jgi:peptidoglycan hydrolase CwlO-like protein